MQHKVKIGRMSGMRSGRCGGYIQNLSISEKKKSASLAAFSSLSDP